MAYRSMQNVIHYSKNPTHEYLPTKPRKKKSKRKNSESTIDNLSFHSQTTGTTQKTGGSTVNTPRDVDAQEKMNYHIKYSSKEDLRKWLKEKDKLHRKKAKEERAKKRTEREKMVLEANEKFEKRLEAQKIYKEWADKKNKEIAKQSRKERKENKRILKEYEEQKVKKDIRPVSAPLQRKDHLPSGGIKVEGTAETNVNLRGNSRKSTNNDSTVTATPHPPTSKFIYKRPVAGRIKLAVNGHGQGGQNANQERPKTASSSRSRSAEGNRMSYDQWVLQKRKQDQKKKELEDKHKQEQMSKSDPDLNKIIPDIAKKRVHNVLEGKKRIDTGVKRIDDKLNKKFGGGDFKAEGQEHENSEQLRYSYRLESDRTEKSSTSGQINVSGTTIKRPPSGTRRPQTAPVGRVPPPKKSSGSPRQAVVPKLEEVMNEENTSNPFKLPFPSEQGVPKHVASRQRQLFAEQVWERLESDERPEPQGSDVPEPATCIGLGSPPDDKREESNVNGKLKTETNKTENNGMQSEDQVSDEKLNTSEKEDGGEIFLTQFNSMDNLNRIENSKFEAPETEGKVEEKPSIEKLNLNFSDNPPRDDVSDSDETPTDREQNDEDLEEKIESVQSQEEIPTEDKASDDGKHEGIGEESNDTTNAETNDKEKKNPENVDILNLDLENTTRSSKRVSFNEDPEVFQTEDWSTDTQTPDEEHFKSGIDNSSNPYEKDNVTSSLDDDF